MDPINDAKLNVMRTGYWLQEIKTRIIANKKPIIVIGSAIVLLVSALLLAYVAQRNLSATDSDALYGGEVETGYPSAGFIVGYANEKIKTCGFSVLGPNVAVTAGHCVDDVQIMYLGKGDFSFNHADQIRVLSAQQKQGWVTDQRREDDFAVLNFVNAGYFSEFAQIAEPVEGCNYRVVAYGRTENPLENSTKPRKSARLCANTIFDKVMYMTSDDASSGICFGDSGSPVYYEGTNTLAGVVASIIKNDNSPSADPCQFGNTAIVVRADKNTQVINDNIQEFNPGSDQVSVDSNLPITLANDQDVNPFTLEGITSISNRLSENWPLMLVGLSIVILLFLAWLVFQDEQKAKQLAAQSATEGFVDAQPFQPS